ncbi:hypothetical protein V1477_007449, partial [Vespula maculifrons]
MMMMMTKMKMKIKMKMKDPRRWNAKGFDMVERIVLLSFFATVQACDPFTDAREIDRSFSFRRGWWWWWSVVVGDVGGGVGGGVDCEALE